MIVLLFGFEGCLCLLGMSSVWEHQGEDPPCLTLPAYSHDEAVNKADVFVKCTTGNDPTFLKIEDYNGVDELVEKYAMLVMSVSTFQVYPSYWPVRLPITFDHFQKRWRQWRLLKQCLRKGCAARCGGTQKPEKGR